MKIASYKAICDAIRNLDVEDAVAVFNEMCYRTNDIDRLIFDMNGLDDLLGQFSIKEAFRLAYLGDFKITDNYVYRIGNGKKAYLYSFSEKSDKNFVRIIDVIELADFIKDSADFERWIEDFDVTEDYAVKHFKDWLINVFVTE